MIKMRKIILSIALMLLAQSGIAQQKYALIVGINQYFTAPGKPSRSALRGCVNDAQSIRSLLINRFGFSNENIILLSDAGANKQAVVNGFSSILSRSRAGDAFLFYFSGHGIWMKNDAQNKLDEKVKQGMNQAMVMSDLYAPKLECLFTDAQVKQTFNKFIDKKVIATGIFDCCFSGKMAMTFGLDFENPYDPELPADGDEKSMPISDLVAEHLVYRAGKQPGYNEDSLNNDLQADGEKAFKMSDLVTIRDSVHIPRPSERAESMYLSLGATDEYEKGLDIADETETYHGAFTAALLYVFKKNKASLPVSTLMKQISEEMKRQRYPQTPLHFADKQRLSKNLIGIPPSGFTENPTAAALSSSNGQTKRAALISVYVSHSGLSDGSFNAGLKSALIERNLRQPNYRDYLHWNKSRSYNIIFGKGFTTTANVNRILSSQAAEDFYVFLPIPVSVTGALQKVLLSNSNVAIAKSAAEADVTLVLNLTKKRELIFTWMQQAPALINEVGMLNFSKSHVVIKSISADSRMNASLALRINDLLVPFIRTRTTQWLSEWPK